MDLYSFFNRGDIPISFTHQASKHGSMLWKIPPEKIDYIYYYPIFVDGLRDPNEKHRSVAQMGCYELLDLFPEKVKDCLPQFILPLKCKLLLNRFFDG